jgi:chromosome segregation ATPase
VGKGYSYSYHSNGESWALVTDASGRVNFNGDWNDGTKGDLDKARKLTSGKFLWFKRDGKSYFIDDLAIMGQVEAMYKPMEELGRQQEILGKKQEELGRQQEALGRKQEEVSIPTPDISKEMARLKEALERLDAKKGGTVSQDELADIEGKIGDVQGRLGEIQGRIGEKQGELGGLQGKLGEEQGKLGEQEGKLGEEQGRLAGEADRKVKSIIDESLHNGKARPVE